MITFSPIQTDTIKVKASNKGDVYSINGVKYDFAQLKDGEILPKDAVGCDFIASDVVRVGTELSFTLLRPYSAKIEDVLATQAAFKEDANTSPVMIANHTGADCFPAPHDNTVDGVIL